MARRRKERLRAGTRAAILAGLAQAMPCDNNAITQAQRRVADLLEVWRRCRGRACKRHRVCRGHAEDCMALCRPHLPDLFNKALVRRIAVYMAAGVPSGLAASRARADFTAYDIAGDLTPFAGLRPPGAGHAPPSRRSVRR